MAGPMPAPRRYMELNRGTMLQEQSATCQGDAVVLVRGRPPLPQGAGRVAEHGASVEALRIAEDGPSARHGRSIEQPLARRTVLLGASWQTPTSPLNAG